MFVFLFKIFEQLSFKKEQERKMMRQAQIMKHLPILTEFRIFY